MNVGRFSIGDAVIFRTNRKIPKGEQLCISYIESELLCAPTSMRHQTLDRDFVCACAKCKANPPQEMESHDYISVDCELQAELALVPALERAQTIQTVLDGEMEEGTVVLGKDAQELRCTQALAL